MIRCPMSDTEGDPTLMDILSDTYECLELEKPPNQNFQAWINCAIAGLAREIYKLQDVVKIHLEVFKDFLDREAKISPKTILDMFSDETNILRTRIDAVGKEVNVEEEKDGSHS